MSAEASELREVPRHDGAPTDTADVFFAQPSAALGALRSRATTLRGESPGGLARFASRWLPAARPVCTYVGSEGVSRHSLCGSRVLDEEVRFADVSELRITREPRGVGQQNGVGRARYSLHDATGKELLVVQAPATTGRDGVALPTEEASFGDAIERAYSEHVVARFDADLRANGRIRFALGARSVVWLGPGFLELETGGTRARLDATEIRSVRVTRGMLEIRSGAAGDAAMGIFRVRLDDTRSVHAFAVVLQQLVGVAMS
jgi:hypothetical protein